ncbi:nucleoside triphosphate pyrophosphohydrolase [bacterium]|nr:MAG: nucleoside triphosphate pyrophosphohydrolase [bacterium]
MDSFTRLTEIMARLRAPGGCPWDREQTNLTLRAYLIEESAEVLQAIETGDDENLCEELGDLILQPIFHAQIAADENRFTLEDVLNGIAEKLIRRHPHVFGDIDATDSAEVLKNWEAIKKEEKAGRGVQNDSVLAEIPAELPALSQALKISKKAAKVGFEWPDVEGVFDKLREETLEIEEALRDKEPKERVAEEIGDLLFTAVNLARWQGINPELALRDVNRKFTDRFQSMEAVAKERGVELESLSPEQWEELWQIAKRK